jgi:hypothetical protein
MPYKLELEMMEYSYRDDWDEKVGCIKANRGDGNK